MPVKGNKDSQLLQGLEEVEHGVELVLLMANCT